MSLLLQLITLARAAAGAAALITPNKADEITAATGIIDRVSKLVALGLEGKAEIEAIAARLQAMHDAGETVTAADLAATLSEIDALAADYAAERAKG